MCPKLGEHEVGGYITLFSERQVGWVVLHPVLWDSAHLPRICKWSGGNICWLSCHRQSDLLTTFTRLLLYMFLIFSFLGSVKINHKPTKQHSTKQNSRDKRHADNTVLTGRTGSWIPVLYRTNKCMSPLSLHLYSLCQCSSWTLLNISKLTLIAALWCYVSKETLTDLSEIRWET